MSWEHVTSLGQAQEQMYPKVKSNEENQRHYEKKGVKMLVQGRMEESQTLSSVESAS